MHDEVGGEIVSVAGRQPCRVEAEPPCARRSSLTAGRPAGKPTCQTRDMDHVRELVVKGPHRCGAKSHEAAVGVVRQP